MTDLSVQETCHILGVTPPTIYKLLGKGDLKGYTIGRSRRITGESIQRLREGKAPIKNRVPKASIYKGMNGYPDVPNALNNDEAITPAQAGIYFFWKGSKIAYVGQSVNIQRRILEHRRNKHMKGLKVSFLLFPEDQLLFAESFYIGICQPKLNAMNPHERD
jgi:excisionase family DNA binding protein